MRLKVECMIPAGALEVLIEALNREKLLGKGKYDFVYTTTPVLGHWRPMKGARPSIGEIGVHSEVEELKVEFVIPESKKVLTEKIVRRYHPYEEPMILFLPLLG